ncbi:hypothetical protein [Nonomuraea sp. NPDC049400]|uniref:hypothetical protein n=1 Tax=Nonomuraea sp. NPDC049400 TaxID=3364352 RepID=UPI0037B7F124
MTVMPQVWCEIAFAKDASGFKLWRDVTDYVEWQEGVRISRRRSHELDEVQPGTLSLTLNNADGRFTAGRTSSPYYPNVTLNRPIRIRARWPNSVNQVTVDQATAATAGAFATGAGTVTRDTTVFPAGQTASIRWDGGVLGSTGQHMWLGSNSVTTATDQAVPVVAGATYSLQTQARRGATAISITARIRWYDAAGAFLSVSAGTSVALTTSFQTVSVSAAAPASAVWARLAIANATTTASNAPVYTGAWQYEQAASPSTYVAPGVEYRRFTGFVDRWPHAWTNGVLGTAQITATDRQKLLSRNKIRRAIVEQTLSTNPRCYYPLGEPAGSEQAGNIAATPQPDMTVQSWNLGGGAEFGANGGPDGTTGVQFTPTDIYNGRFLLTSLTTPLGGVAGVSVALWVNFGATTQTGQNRLIFVDNGTDNVHLRVNYSPFTNSLSLGARTAAGAVSGSTTSVNLDNLQTHLLVATAQFSGGTMQLRVYADGVLVINTNPALSGSTWPSLSRIRIGGLPGTALDPPEMLMGLVSHVACWNSVLTLSDAQALSNAGGGFAGELSGARAARIATWAGVTNTAFDTGSSLMDSNPSAEQTPLAAFKQVAFSEAGIFFVSGDDVVTIHGRNRRQLPASVSISLAAHQLGADLQFTMDDQLLINDVSVSRSGKSVTRVVDQSSIDENEGTYAASIDTLLYSDTEALDRAAYTVTTYGHPQPRAGQISVDAHSVGTVWDQLLASEIGQRIQITGLPSEAPAATVDLWCEGVADVIGDGTWSFVLDTSPVRDTPVFILDDPTYGTLDNNYLGW